MDVQMWNKSMLKKSTKAYQVLACLFCFSKMRTEPSKEEFQDE